MERRVGINWARGEPSTSWAEGVLGRGTGRRRVQRNPEREGKAAGAGGWSWGARVCVTHVIWPYSKGGGKPVKVKRRGAVGVVLDHMADYSLAAGTTGRWRGDWHRLSRCR